MFIEKDVYYLLMKFIKQDLNVVHAMTVDMKIY